MSLNFGFHFVWFGKIVFWNETKGNVKRFYMELIFDILYEELKEMPKESSGVYRYNRIILNTCKYLCTMGGKDMLEYLILNTTNN